MINKKRFTVILAILLSISILSAALPSVSAYSKKEKKAEYKEGEAVVILKDNAGSKFFSKKKAENAYGKGVKIKNKFKLGENKKIRITSVKASDKSTEELVDELNNNENVEYAVPNYIIRKSSVTNDAYSDYQWALKNTGHNCGTEDKDTKAYSLWDKASLSSKENVVAVMDSGIDLTHEDLKDVIWKNPRTDKLEGEYGYDFTGTNKNGNPVDGNHHGTHVAGIIAASADNGKGVSGINKTNTKIMALKILDDEGGGEFEYEVAAFEYLEKAISLGVNVVALNCSYGYIGNSSTLKFYNRIFNELGEMGVTTCIASGNEYANLNNIHNQWSEDYIGSNQYYVPACTDSKYAVTVAASDENDNVASFSNVGDEYVDIAAPGVDILSTVNYNSFQPTVYNEQQKESLCAYYQGFNTKPNSGDYNIEYADSLSAKTTKISYENGFGPDGKSLGVNGSGYILEFPFTLDNENDDYYLSFMTRVLGNTEFYYIDVPKSYDSLTNLSAIARKGEVYSYTGTDWDHCVLKSSPSSFSYRKALDRKLVIYVYSAEGLVQFDDLGVSKQGVDEKEFGKYDFSAGTSMACPYVSGAVALIKSSYKDISPVDVINMMKSTGRVSPYLHGKVENAVSLSLDKTEDYSYEPTESTTLPVFEDPTQPSTGAPEPSEKTKVILHSSSASLYVGKTMTIGYNTENSKGKTTFRSLNKKVASVNSAGKVKALKKGKAVIIVSNNGASAKFNVTVKNPYLKAKFKKIKVGKKYKIKIVGKVGKATFKSANKKIASVTKKGVVKAKKKGTTKITVKTNGKIKLKFKVIVIKKTSDWELIS